MEIKQYKINLNVGLKVLLLIGFASFYIHTIYTETVRQYVHPRIIPYMIFASIVMVIIAILLLGELFKEKNGKINSWPLIFFVIPLIMGFSFPAKTFDSSTRTSKDIYISSEKSISANKENPIQPSKQDVKPIENNTETQDNTENLDLNGLDTKNETEDEIILHNGVVEMNSDNFYQCLNVISENIDKYEGMLIEVVGFVFKDNDGFSDNEFVPARFMMVCCAADMVPIGFLCHYGDTQKLNQDSWVKVTGTIEKGQFQGETIPIIEAVDVQKTDKPINDYVYPY